MEKRAVFFVIFIAVVLSLSVYSVIMRFHYDKTQKLQGSKPDGNDMDWTEKLFEMSNMEPVLPTITVLDEDYTGPDPTGLATFLDGVFVFNRTFLLENYFVWREGGKKTSIMFLKSDLKVNREVQTLTTKLECDNIGYSTADGEKKQIQLRLNGKTPYLENVQPGIIALELRILYPNEQVSGVITCNIIVLSDKPAETITKTVKFKHE